MTAELESEIAAHKQAVLDALKGYKDAASFAKILNEHRTPFRSTKMESWFLQVGQAEKAALVAQGYANKVSMAKLTGQPPPDIASTRKGIDDLKKNVSDSALLAVMDEFKNQVGT